MNKKNYFIKDGYKTNPPNIVKELNTNFWTIREHSEFRIYIQYYIYETAKKLLKKCKLKSVLDIGCGAGTKLMKLIYPVCNDVSGIDNSTIININKEKYNSESFFSDDIENPKLTLNRKFDLIISADVIEHLINPDNLLSYIKKYSHKNTYILLSTPERDILSDKNNITPANKGHIREWNKEELSLYLKNKGFNILYHNMVMESKIFPSVKFRLGNFLKDYVSLSKKPLMYRTIKKMRYQQLVICSLTELNIPKINKLKISYFFSVMIIKFNLIIKKLYNLPRKIKELINRFLHLFKDSELKKINKNVSGFLSFSQGLELYKLAKKLPNEGVLVEIGSFLGRATCFIAEAIKDKNIKFLTMDTFQNQGMTEKINDVYSKFLNNVKDYKDLIVVRKGFSHDVVKDFKYIIDMMFIDGDHRYSGIVQDIEDWLPLVRKNGIIAFHDYCIPRHKKEAVKQVVDEELRKGSIKKIKLIGNLLITKKI